MGTFTRLDAQSDTCFRHRAMYKGGLGLAGGGSLTALALIWYKDQSRTGFHWYDDSGDWLQMDKVGHAAGGYMLAEIVRRSSTWSCYDESKARRQALIWPLAYMSLIEVMDGFSNGYGASWADLGANASGALLYHYQDKAWGEQRLRMKWSFNRTGYAAYRPELMGDGWHEEMLKDYNGQSYWLSVNLSSMGLTSHLPEWLNLAFGYGAEGMIGGRNNTDWQDGITDPLDPDRCRQFYLSPDIDLTRISVDKRWLKRLLNLLNYIKVPMPALELSKGRVKFHPLYF